MSDYEQNTAQQKHSKRKIPTPSSSDRIDTDSDDIVILPAKATGKKIPLSKLAEPKAVVAKVVELEEKTEKKRRRKASSEPRASINDWPGLDKLAEVSRISSVTCVDPGTANLAVIRFEFLPTFRMTHAKVLNLSVLATELEHKNPLFRLRSNRGVEAMEQEGEFTMQAKLAALRLYVAQEAEKPGGLFNSDFLLVEEQSFDRLMARVESTIIAVYESVRGSQFTVLENSTGGTVGRAQVATARSVKSYFRPLFPPVSADRVASSKRRSSSARPFGMGDSHNGESEAQRREHKRNSMKYGSMLIPQHQFGLLVPPENISSYDRQRLRENKMDDLYDTLFMAMYFVSSTMFTIYKIRTNGVSRALPAYETLPPRPETKYEELTELANVVGTESYELQLLYEALYGDEAPKVT